jgi:hypothetical protein
VMAIALLLLGFLCESCINYDLVKKIVGINWLFNIPNNTYENSSKFNNIIQIYSLCQYFVNFSYFFKKRLILCKIHAIIEVGIRVK